MYRSIETSLWSDPRIRKLDPSAKLAFLYLITNSHAHLSGIYSLPLFFMSYETGLPDRVLDSLFDTLSIGNLAFFDPEREVVFVKNMFRYQGRGEKNEKSAAKQLPTLHGTPLIHLFIDAYPNVKAFLDDDFLDTVSHTLSDRVSDKEQEQEQEQDKPSTCHLPMAPGTSTKKQKWSDDEKFVALKLKYPKRAGSQRWPDAFKAYRARLREGAAWDEINDGLDRYIAFCNATHKTGTETVLMMATFLGPNLCFQEAYDLPRQASNATSPMRDLSGMDYGKAGPI